jgi:hypothetical protein
MPKIDIDYSNTIIYKITCNDDTIKDVYVGHTTNFVQRKYAHKQCCLNNNLNKCKLYEVIRNNGGWNNWTMEIVNFFNCKDHNEARQKEQDYFVSLNASLNSVEPFPLKDSNNKEFYCEICNFKCYKKSKYLFHLLTTKHKLTVSETNSKTNSNNSNSNNTDKFNCENCNFYTSHKNDYKIHLLTTKHKNLVLKNNNIIKKKQFLFTCNKCNKIYNTQSGLWKHNQKCSDNQIVEDTTQKLEQKDELISYLIKENQEFKGLILEVCKNFQQSNISCNNNTINSHNKTFNLQVFLNETCKDAMNLSEFIDSFDLKLSDLESMGKLGFVDGISNIIIKKLNSLDVEKRPIHCSDTKRETMYIKDDDKWEKEGDDMKRLKKVITEIQTRNIKLIPKWKELYPDCILSNSKHTDKFNDICIEIMGGKGSDILQKEVKIIKKIAKEVAIDKEKF